MGEANFSMYFFLYSVVLMYKESWRKLILPILTFEFWLPWYKTMFMYDAKEICWIVKTFCKPLHLFTKLLNDLNLRPPIDYVYWIVLFNHMNILQIAAKDIRPPYILIYPSWLELIHKLKYIDHRYITCLIPSL